MSVKKPARNGAFAVLYCAIFRTPNFGKSLKFFGTSDASLDTETVQLTILHTIRHVYRSVWSAREAKPRFGAALVIVRLGYRPSPKNKTNIRYNNHNNK